MTASALLGPLFLCSCYVQTPLGMAPPVADQQVVVRLTDRGAEEVTRWVGPGVTAVEGMAGTGRSDTLEIRVRSTTQRGGEISFWNGETVLIPLSAVASVSERRLSPRRSGLLAGVVTVGALLAASMFGLVGSSEAPPGGGPVPPQ